MHERYENWFNDEVSRHKKKRKEKPKKSDHRHRWKFFELKDRPLPLRSNKAEYPVINYLSSYKKKCAICGKKKRGIDEFSEEELIEARKEVQSWKEDV